MYETNAHAPLMEGETVFESFYADRAIYVRDHVVMALLASLGAMLILHWMNEIWWVGTPAALAAIGVRAFYLASDDLTARWDLTQDRLLGPQGRAVALDDVDQLRALGSALQIVTRGGDKHLIKYLADRETVRTRIEAALAHPGGVMP